MAASERKSVESSLILHQQKQFQFIVLFCWIKTKSCFEKPIQSDCEDLTPYIHLAYHGLRVERWSAKIAVANLAVFISIQKKIMFEWHTDKNHFLWFVLSFAHVATLWSCLRLIESRSFNNITSQIINCWIGIQRTNFFFFHEKSYMMNLNIWLFNNKKTKFSKNHSKILY